MAYDTSIYDDPTYGAAYTSQMSPPPAPGFTNGINRGGTPLPSALPGGTILRPGVNPLQLPGSPGAAGNTGITGGAPTGGSLRDPAYVAKLVAYYADQPGANPSLKNDPQYWIHTITTSPEWATATQDFAVSKFMQPEGAPKGGVDTSGLLGNGSAIAPFTDPMPGWSTPAPFAYQPFQQPDYATLLQDPGYQARFGEGMRGVQSQAAARGLLKTGGTLKGLVRYGQDFASNEVGNQFQRSLSGWQNNYGLARDLYDTNVLKPNDLSYNRGTADWITKRDTFWKNQSGAFDKSYQVARLGLDANA